MEWSIYWKNIKMKLNRPIFVILLLLCALAASFALPKTKYKSPDILSKLEIPFRFPGWQGKDAGNLFNPNDLRYNFISKIFARIYANQYKENLLFLILDAGNFHNPKVCTRGAGNTITDLPNLELKALNHTFQAQAIYVQKGNEGTLLVYWICINKKLMNWTGQKITQLLYSMFNKEKIGLMVRLDIPARKETLNQARALAQKFVSDISSQIPAEQAEYIFGM